VVEAGSDRIRSPKAMGDIRHLTGRHPTRRYPHQGTQDRSLETRDEIEVYPAHVLTESHTVPSEPNRNQGPDKRRHRDDGPEQNSSHEHDGQPADD